MASQKTKWPDTSVGLQNLLDENLTEMRHTEIHELLDAKISSG
jgi:hypothetical protein